MREKLFAYAKEKYHAEPEYLWARDPESAILRNSNNQKWFAVIMRISKDKLGLKNKELVWIADFKCDPLLIGSFLQLEGHFPAYHMNKNHWITVLLDGSVKEEQIFQLLDLSYCLIERKK
ncbi:MAG: MmcQ/YjbR family DNA-binding protein, partial [Oscillospiraceae bacterium]|nr:MmcQ/YjbR family DNA-binding protein [Oscillospiraceae bacterium]